MPKDNLLAWLHRLKAKDHHPHEHHLTPKQEMEIFMSNLMSIVTELVKLAHQLMGVCDTAKATILSLEAKVATLETENKALADDAAAAHAELTAAAAALVANLSTGASMGGIAI